MDKEFRLFHIFFCCVIALVVALFVSAPILAWKAAGAQQQVWERQGIHMTQWEVFIGAKPIQRVIVETHDGTK